MVLLAAFNVLLYRYSGKEDILVGTAVANRTIPETQDIMGLFMNMIVLRSKVDGNVKFIDLLQQVKDTALKGFAHQELPFERLVEELKPKRDLSRNPIFQVAFIQNVPRTPLETDETVITAENLYNQGALFDITLYMNETSENVSYKISLILSFFSSLKCLWSIIQHCLMEIL